MAVIDDQFWRHTALLYWIYCVVESRTGDGLPKGSKRLKTNTWEKMPKEIKESVYDADTQQVILAAVDRGSAWFCRLEDAGWRAGEPKGAKSVQMVQDLLEWINAFHNKGTVKGNKLVWCTVDSKVE